MHLVGFHWSFSNFYNFSLLTNPVLLVLNKPCFICWNTESLFINQFPPTVNSQELCSRLTILARMEWQEKTTKLSGLTWQVTPGPHAQPRIWPRTLRLLIWSSVSLRNLGSSTHLIRHSGRQVLRFGGVTRTFLMRWVPSIPRRRPSRSPMANPPRSSPHRARGWGSQRGLSPSLVLSATHGARDRREEKRPQAHAQSLQEDSGAVRPVRAHRPRGRAWEGGGGWGGGGRVTAAGHAPGRVPWRRRAHARPRNEWKVQSGALGAGSQWRGGERRRAGVCEPPPDAGLGPSCSGPRRPDPQPRDSACPEAGLPLEVTGPRAARPWGRGGERRGVQWGGGARGCGSSTWATSSGARRGGASAGRAARPGAAAVTGPASSRRAGGSAAALRPPPVRLLSRPRRGRPAHVLPGSHLGGPAQRAGGRGGAIAVQPARPPGLAVRCSAGLGAGGTERSGRPAGVSLAPRCGLRGCGPPARGRAQPPLALARTAVRFVPNASGSLSARSVREAGGLSSVRIGDLKSTETNRCRWCLIKAKIGKKCNSVNWLREVDAGSLRICSPQTF